MKVATAGPLSAMSENAPPADNSQTAEKVRSFPPTPGVYLMKDAAGRVIYVGKAKNLRSRAGSYFLKAAAEDPRTAKLVAEIRDLDYLDAESEIDALLVEARLIKDILPKYNKELTQYVKSMARATLRDIKNLNASLQVEEVRLDIIRLIR